MRFGKIAFAELSGRNGVSMLLRAEACHIGWLVEDGTALTKLDTCCSGLQGMAPKTPTPFV
jgi:hypothetical protein